MITNGVIQNVLDKYYDRITAKDIMDLKYSLIDAINKLPKHQTRYHGQLYTAVSLRALIGDNR